MHPNLERFFQDRTQPIAEAITYHLVIEGLLEEILRQKPSLQGLDFRRMRFSDKARRAHTEGLISTPKYEVVRKVNNLRNEFAHNLAFEPTFDDIHALVVEAGKAGVDFTDGIDATDKAYIQQLNYTPALLLNALCRNLFYELAYEQPEQFWEKIVS